MKRHDPEPQRRVSGGWKVTDRNQGTQGLPYCLEGPPEESDLPLSAISTFSRFIFLN